MLRLVTLGGLAVWALQRLRGRIAHVVVAGGSMTPTLEAGDRLVALRRAGPVRRGQLVLAPDPRAPERLLIKRVAAVHDGRVELRGDAVSASTDSRTFGTVPADLVTAVSAYRYFPVERAGKLSSPRAPRCRAPDHPPAR